MASTATLEGVKKAVFFPFRGKDWGSKMAIGSALTFAGSIFIIPSFFVMGYCAQIIKKVILQDEDPELPEWTDWGTLFVDGLKIFGAVVIYMLPAILLIVGGYLLMFGLNMAFFLAMIPASASSDPGSFSVALPILGSWAGAFLGTALIMLGMVFAFVCSFFIPPAIGHLIAKGDFGAAFRIREWWPVLKVNLGGYILTLVITTGSFSVLYMLMLGLYASIVLCFLLPFAVAIMGFLFGLIAYSLYGVSYRDGSHKIYLKSA